VIPLPRPAMAIGIVADFAALSRPHWLGGDWGGEAEESCKLQAASSGEAGSREAERRGSPRRHGGHRGCTEKTESQGREPQATSCKLGRRAREAERRPGSPRRHGGHRGCTEKTESQGREPQATSCKLGRRAREAERRGSPRRHGGHRGWPEKSRRMGAMQSVGSVQSVAGSPALGGRRGLSTDGTGRTNGTDWTDDLWSS